MVVLHRIEALAAEFLECLADGKILELEARDSSAMIYDQEKQQQFHGNETRLIKLNRKGGRRYTGIWLILQTAHALLTENKTATQRDVYYLHSFFKGQSEADEAILDAGSILGIPRGHLNIVGATKGCFTGDISMFVRQHKSMYDAYARCFNLWLEARRTVEAFCERRRGFYYSRTSAVETKRSMVPSILITGRGFPDLATSLLSNALNIPVLGLCDCNPFGLSIMLTYKLGSARMPLESLQYGMYEYRTPWMVCAHSVDLYFICTAVDIKWVGVRPSQVAALGLPNSAFKLLTRKDIAVAGSLMRASFIQVRLYSLKHIMTSLLTITVAIQTNEDFKHEVQMWLADTLPWKIELEALHLLGFTFLTSFLKNCIQEGNFL
ncbi:Meiotic recombination protein SPO11 [Phytophthora citrophthora]|uniref:DNA topoisomerase (ATP-hydrolyzing) n=1 Tax=Phytophthora citrophthora TaxID=4793 RepID=A0AAD9GUX8_9STRA|nr:Meiotic recombination protein SPO11 [Phytophthora citrophthora]